jgi:PAS domain S-box-containing protein
MSTNGKSPINRDTSNLEERLWPMTEALGGLVYDYDLATGQVYKSRGMFELVGYQPDETADNAQWWRGLVYPEDFQQVKQAFDAVITSQVSTYTSEYRVRHRDGHYIWVQDTARILYDEDGQPRRMVGCTVSIDDRKRAEQALLESRALEKQQYDQIQAIYDAAPVGLCVLDKDLRYVRVNERLAEMNGLPAAAHLGRTVRELLPGLADEVEPGFRRVLETGEALLNIEINGETPAQPGITRYWLESWTPLRDSSGNIIGVSIVAEEITERKQAERRAHILQQLAAALSSALTPKEVADEIIRYGIQALGATAGSISLVNQDGTQLELLKVVGYPPEMLERWTHFPVSSETAPISIAVRTQTPLYYRSLEALRVAMRQNFVAPLAVHHAWAALPLVVNGDAIGGLGLSFPTEQGFDESERAFMLTLADLCAQALERAQLSEKAKAASALEERQRLARDLHDSVTQTLFTSSVMAESVPRLAERNPQRATQILNQVVSLNRAAWAEMRTLLLELRPDTIEKALLSELMRYLIDATKSRRDMQTELRVMGQEGLLAPQAHVAFYRVAQESINNIIKHSHATAFTVDLTYEGQQVSLRIADNGQGFNPQRQSSGMGMGSMRERAAAIGADLGVTSSPGSGTAITLTWTSHPNGAVRSGG